MREEGPEDEREGGEGRSGQAGMKGGTYTILQNSSLGSDYSETVINEKRARMLHNFTKHKEKKVTV